MAEKCNQAFGRYLRILRERKGLSLDQVASLSQTFPETINKGYLSRCENGHQKLAFVKLVPLSRIYDVPADVLVERMELDMELDRVGGPETEGKDFGELTLLGGKAIADGFSWAAYGYLRDAVVRAPHDPVRPSFRDQDEQYLIAQMSCGTAAVRLQRYRFASHEFRYIESDGRMGPRFSVLVLERMAACLIASKDYELAADYAQRAVDNAISNSEEEYLGYTYSTQARVAYKQGDHERSLKFYRLAFDAYKSTARNAECVQTLNNIGQSYFDLGQHRAARRSLLAASRLSSEHDQVRLQALSQLLLGEIDELEDNEASAVRRWKNVVDVAKRLDDKELRFKSEFLLLRRAVKNGNFPVARAIHRRLRKLAPWVTEQVDELSEFRALESQTDLSA